jgi:ERF superfamily
MKEIYTALHKAQMKMQGALKDSNNPFFKSKYADLSSVAEAVKSGIEGTGLAYFQRSQMLAGHAAIETVITHESGQHVECGVISVPTIKNDPQAFGSALTYARRYSLAAAFGVLAEDDDGNKASLPYSSPKKTNPSDLAKAQQEAIEAENKRLASMDLLLDNMQAVTTLDSLKTHYIALYKLCNSDTERKNAKHECDRLKTKLTAESK